MSSICELKWWSCAKKHFKPQKLENCIDSGLDFCIINSIIGVIMLKSGSTIAKKNLYKIACQQQGYFTVKQAKKAGYSQKHHSYHVQCENWIREIRGIYRLPYFPQNDEDAQLILWYLWSRDRNEKPQGVYSYETALRIYDVSDLMPSKLHMSVPATFRRFNPIPKILVLHKADLKKHDTSHIRGFAVTTPSRTILDLIESKRIEKNQIKKIFHETLKKGMLSPKDEKKIKKVMNDEK